MTFEEQLKKKMEEHPTTERIDLKDLPDEIKAKVTKYEFKEDATKRECLYLTFITQDKRTFTQKYTMTSWEELNKKIKEAGGMETLTNNYITWKKETIGRMTKPRMFPTATKPTKK